MYLKANNNCRVNWKCGGRGSQYLQLMGLTEWNNEWKRGY